MAKNISKSPLVSVLMTAYNAEPFIEKALLSIINQTYQNLEIIVVDDGSTDNTEKILTRLKKTDRRLKIFRLKQNLGPSLASNFGLTKTRGKFVARMDADDISLPDRIEKQIKFLLRNADIAIVGGQCILIDENGEVIGKKNFPTNHQEIYDALFSINPIQHPSCMINTGLLPRKALYYHNHSLLAHDLELVFKIAQYGKLANLPNIILYYRQHHNSLSLRDPKMTFRATLRVRQRAVQYFGYRPTLKGRLIHSVQTVVVNLLPAKSIYPLFRILHLKQQRFQFLKFLPILKLRKWSLYRLAID